MKITPFTTDILDGALQNISLAMIEDKEMVAKLSWQAVLAGGEAERLIVKGDWKPIDGKASRVITQTEIPCQDKSVMATVTMMHEKLMAAV